MKVYFKESFLRDIKNIKDKKLLKKIKKEIENFEKIDKLLNFKNLKKLKGYRNFYRIKEGDYRIGLQIIKNKVYFVRVLHRKDIYKYFP